MSKQDIDNSDEIDLVELLKKIWWRRKNILKITTAFALVGLTVALLSKAEYTANTSLIPQVSSKFSGGGSFSSLANIAGIDLGGLGGNDGNTVIPPGMYPKIVESTPFQLELINTKINIKGEKEPVTFKHYYNHIYKQSFFTKIYDSIKNFFSSKKPSDGFENNDIINMNKEDHEVIKKLNKQLSINIDKKEGLIALSISMPEAVASAQMTLKAQQLLQKFITAYKVKKAKDDLEFIQSGFEEKKAEFQTIQKKLALFKDKNKYVNTELYKTELELIKADYNLALSIFNELAKQLEAAKLKVKENTPVFTVIEPVRVPLEKSNLGKRWVVLIFTLLGFILSVFLSLMPSLQQLKDMFSKNE